MPGGPPRMIGPGQTLGILGNGPIGRMLGQAALSLGYRVHVFDAEQPGSAGAIAHKEVHAAFEDVVALAAFARECAVVTCERENLPSASLEAVAAVAPLYPRVEVLHVCNHRQRQKAWLHAHGFPHVRYAEALDGEIAAAAAIVGLPCVVKTADFASDGKGQMKITDATDLEKARAIFRSRRCIVERWVEFSCELSVIVARASTGEVRALPVIENIHRQQVLEVSVTPARVNSTINHDAELLATAIATRLNAVGLLAVEMFVTTGGELLVNELVPRPHNSGHGSIEGCETSQFEQHVRAVCGLPLGPCRLRAATVMVNILGDAWHWKDGQVAGPPNWDVALAAQSAKLHVYGLPPRLGRKMGHLTVFGDDVDSALALARTLQTRI